MSSGDKDEVHNDDSGKATGTEIRWGSKSGETQASGEWQGTEKLFRYLATE